MITQRFPHFHHVTTRQMAFALLKQCVLVAVVAVGHAFFFAFSENWWFYPKYSTWYMPLGWVLGVLLILPYRYWPGVFLGVAVSFVFIIWGSAPQPLMGTLSSFWHHAIFYLLPLFLTHRLLRRYSRKGYLQTLSGCLLLLLLVVVNQLGNVAQMGEWIWSGSDPADELEIRLTHFVGGATGILVVTPCILALHGFWQQGNPLTNRHLAELVVVLASIATLAIAVYLSYPQTWYLLRALIFLPVLYCAYRFGWVGAWAATTLVNVGLLAVVHGEPALEVVRDTQFYVFVYGISGLLLGAVFSDLQASHQRLSDQNRALNLAAQQVQKLAAKVVRIQEQERKSLAQALHDEVGQNVVSLQTRLEALQVQFPPLRDSESVRGMKQDSNEIYQSVYQLLHWLRPRVLDEFGLHHTLTGDYFAKRLRAAGIDFHARVFEQADALPQDTSISIFRIVQEAVTNCIKYSQGSSFYLRLGVQNNRLLLDIKDNGIGFPVEDEAILSGSGFGLQGMLDRVHAQGGDIHFYNQSGACIKIGWPQ